MKIEKTLFPKGLEPTKGASTKGQTGPSFEEILGKKLSEGQPSLSIPPATIAPLISLAPEEVEGLRRAEEVLDILDNIARLLDQRPISGQAPAQGLEDQSWELAQLVKDLQPGPVRSLIEEVAILASVEAAKIRRGDYS
ncbi:hypothetical protein [Thermosulfuriphilus sp.]